MLLLPTLIPAVVKRLKSIPVGSYVDLRPYKRNRSVMITKLADDLYEVREEGFFADTFTCSLDKLKKQMKTLIKKEFPRSNKVRMYTGVVGDERGPATIYEE